MPEKKTPPTPNDQRSNTINSNNRPPHENNPDYKGKIDNRSGQLDPKQKK